MELVNLNESSNVKNLIWEKIKQNLGKIKQIS